MRKTGTMTSKRRTHWTSCHITGITKLLIRIFLMKDTVHAQVCMNSLAITNLLCHTPSPYSEKVILKHTPNCTSNHKCPQRAIWMGNNDLTKVFKRNHTFLLIRGETRKPICRTYTYLQGNWRHSLTSFLTVSYSFMIAMHQPLQPKRVF